MFGFNNYNYEKFQRSQLVKDMTQTRFGDAPEPGNKAPDFTLRNLHGDRVTLSDFRHSKNVVLTFGSATCPQTAASISGINELYDEFSDRDVELLFVYVREAHPGDELHAHRSMKDKVRAAELLRDEEEVSFDILVDDLNGKVHRKYGSMPNPTFLIDKSGRIAFRSLASRKDSLAEAIGELLERQRDRSVEHAVVSGGEDTVVPPLKMMLHAHRALERGGGDALRNFRSEMGMPGRMALIGSRVARPVVENPGASIATAVAAAGVVTLGFWVGRELRKRRFRNDLPYHMHDLHQRRARTRGDEDDYEAVGI